MGDELTKKCNIAYEVLRTHCNIDCLYKVEKNVIKLIGIKDLVAFMRRGHVVLNSV